MAENKKFMSPFFGKPKEEETSEQKPMGYFDALFGDFKTGVGANFDSAINGARLNYQRGDIVNPSFDTTPEEYDALLEEHRKLAEEQAQTRQTAYETRKRLEDSGHNLLARGTTIGGSLPGLAINAGATALSGLAAVSGLGSWAAPLIRAGGVAASSAFDAYSAASEAADQVLENGGTEDQAYEAFTNAFPKQMVTAVPDAFADYLLSSKIAKGIAKTSVAQKLARNPMIKNGKSFLSDPASKVGTAIASATKSRNWGRVGSAATDILGQEIGEGIQETGQNYISNVEANRVLGKGEREYSLGGYGDYLTSDEGIETLKDVGLTTLVLGGAGSVLGSGQSLGKGYSDTNATKAVEGGVKNWENIKLDIDEKRFKEAKSDFQRGTGIDVSDYSPTDFARTYVEYYNNADGDHSQEHSKYALNEVVKQITGENNIDRKTLSDKSVKWFANEDMKQFEEQREMLTEVKEESNEENNANGEIDNADAVEQTATGQQVGETTQQQNGENTIKLTKRTAEGLNDTTPYSDKVKQQGTTEPISPNASNSVFSQHFDPDFNAAEETTEGYDNKTYDLGGGHKVRLTAKEDGTFTVLDLTNPQNTKANVYQNWESAYSEMKRLQQQYAKEDASATRNLKATDGVLADKDDPAKSGKTEDVRKGTFAFTVDDIWNYYDNHIRGNAELEKEFGGTYGMMRLAQVLRAKDFDNTDIVFSLGLDREQHDSEGNRVLGGAVFYTKDGRALTVNGSIAEEAQILRQQGVQKAIISLYRGNDVVTAMHELFHVGFWTMTEQERGYFYRIAPRTQNEFAERILRIKVAHENELREKEGKAPVSQDILNTIMDKEKPIDVYNYLETVIKAQDHELYELIRDDASFSQTFELLKYQDVDVVKMLNQNGKLPDALQRALEERYAWEGSLWYAEGYVRSIKPVTAIQRILDRICHSLSTALGLVWDCSIRLNQNNHIEVDGRKVAYDPTVSFANLSIQTRDPMQQQQEQQAPVQEQTPATTQEQPFNPYETQSNDRFVDTRLTAIPWYKPDYSTNKKPVHNTNKLEVIFTRAINGDEKARDWFNRRVSQEQQEQILNKYLERPVLEQEANNEQLNGNYDNIPAVEDRFMDRVINEKEDAPEKTRGRKNDKREKQRRETQQRSIDTFKDGYNNFTDEEIPWSRTPFSQPRGVQKVSDKLARDLYERMTDETIPEKYRGRAETLFMTKIPIEQQKEVISEYEKVNKTPEQTEQKQNTVSINPEVQETQQNSQNQRQEEQQNKENKVVDNEDYEEVKEEKEKKPNTTTQEWQDIPDKNAQRIYEKMMKGDERAKKHWDKLNSKQKERIINNNKTKEEERIRQEEQQNEENKVATPEKQGTRYDVVNNFINEREEQLDKAEKILDTFISKNSDVDKLDINEIEKIFDNDEYRTIPTYISVVKSHAEKFLKNKEYERFGSYKDSKEKEIIQKLNGLIERAENLYKKYIAFDDKLIEERDKKEEQEKKREEGNHKEEEVKQEDKYEKEIREKIGEQDKGTVQTLKTVLENVDDWHERIQKYENGELKTVEEKRNFLEEMRNKIYPLLQELKIVQNLPYVNHHGSQPGVSAQELSTKFNSPYPYATNRVESVLKEVVKHAGEMLGETLEESSIVAGKPVYRMSTGRKRLEQLYKKYFGGKPELIDIRLTDNQQIKEKQTDTPAKEKIEQTKEQQPTKQKQERNEQKEEPKKEENKEQPKENKVELKQNTTEEMKSVKLPWKFKEFSPDSVNAPTINLSDKIKLMKYFSKILFHRAMWGDTLEIRNSDEFRKLFSLYAPIDLQNKIIEDFKKIRKEVQQNVENEEDKKIKKDIEQAVFLSNANAEAITEITKGKYKNELYNEKYRTGIYNIIQNKLNVINQYNKKISGEKLKAYVRGRLEEDMKSHLSVAGDLLGETKIDKKGKEVYVISDKKQRKDLINLYKKYYGEEPTLTDPRLQKQNNEQEKQQKEKQPQKKNYNGLIKNVDEITKPSDMVSNYNKKEDSVKKHTRKQIPKSITKLLSLRETVGSTVDDNDVKNTLINKINETLRGMANIIPEVQNDNSIKLTEEERKELTSVYKEFAQEEKNKPKEQPPQEPNNILNRRVNGNFKVNNFDEMEKVEVPWSVMKVENMRKRVSFDDLTGDVTREQAEEWFKTATDPDGKNQNEKFRSQALFSLLVPSDVQKQIVQQAEQNTETTKQNDTEKTDNGGFVAKIGTKKIKIKNEEDILGYTKQQIENYNEEEAKAGIEDADEMVNGEPRQTEKPEVKRKLTTLEKNFINKIANREDFLNDKSETFRNKVAKIKEELDKIVSGETEGLKNSIENAEELLKEISYADGTDEKMQPYAQYFIKKISQKRSNTEGSHDMAFLLKAQLSLTQKYGKKQVDITEEQKQQVDDLMEYVVNPYMQDNERNNKSMARKEKEQAVDIGKLHKEIEKCFDEFDKWLYRKERHGTTRYMKMSLNDGRLRKRLENEYQKEFLIEGKKLGFDYDETKKIGQVINLVKRVMDRYNSQTPLLYLNPNDDLVFGERVKSFLKINHNVNEKIWERSMSNKKKYQVDGLGVYRNLDGTWMVEISDKDATINSDKLVQDLLQNGGDLVGKEYKLSDILNHDELYKKLPKLKDTTVYFVDQEDFNKNKKAKKYKGIDNVDFSGLYSYENKALYINLDKSTDLNIKQTLAQNVEQGNIQKALSTARQLFDKMRGTILHETQHAVQHMTRSVSANANKVIALVLHNDLNKVYDFIEKNAGKQAVEKAKGMLGTETSSILKFLNKKTGTTQDQRLQDLLHDYMNQDEFYFADLDEMEAYDTENRATTGDESKLPLTQGKVEYDGKTYDAYNDVLQGKGLVQRNQMGSQQERVQRSQQILNTAFPNVRFQYAWHSTPHDFDAFTLDHLLEGEGAMAHGWGLYFAKSLPKNYENYFKKFNGGLYSLRQKFKNTQIKCDNIDVTKQLPNSLIISIIETQNKNGIINKGEVNDILDRYVDGQKRYLESTKREINELERSGKYTKYGGYIVDEHGVMFSIERAERDLNEAIKLKNEFGGKELYISGLETQSRFLFVDIPNDNVLLRESEGYYGQPEYVQQKIRNLIQKELGVEKEKVEDYINSKFYGAFNGYVYGALSYRLKHDYNYDNKTGQYTNKTTGTPLSITTNTENHQELVSRLLNKYGIKGISYNGRQDGECVVVFDNKAADIINKFKKEEGKWVSNKPQPQKQELTDTQKQRVERKLQEKKQSESATRYMGYGKPRMTKKKKEAMQEERKKWIKNQRLDAVTEQKIAYEHKDVYSVSFEKDAQNNPTNQKKMAYFEKNDIFWDKDEDQGTGRITYTRKVPEDHHKKVMSYSGINGIDVKQKEKTKWEEWKDWVKDRLIKYLINDRHFLAKAAMEIGAYDKYMAMVVAIDETKVANYVMEHGIKKPDGTYTKSLNAIIKDVGEKNQKLFNDYCIAFRVLDLLHHKRWRLMPKIDDQGNIMRDANGNLIMEDVEYEKKIIQKMTEKEARELIAKVKNNKEIADLFEENRKAFVEYNHELLRVLVDGGIMTQKAYNNMLKSDPNYVPLSKVMDDEDFGYLSALRASSLVNINGPVREIGNSVREVANPLAEMQKRTAMYYSIASRNKAGRIFVNEIANKIEVLANGDKVARGQGLIRRVTLQERNNKLITKPDDRDQIIYIWNNGQKEYYQVASRDVYEALKTLDHEQLGIISKLLTPARLPAKLVRETATMVPDFGLRNFVRDNFEAFYTSENGFIPFWDGVWGIYQIINDTEWAREFYKYNGEYGTLNRENGDGIVSVDDVIDDKLNPITNIKNVWSTNKKIFDDPTRAWTGFTDLKGGNFGKAWENTRKGRALALFKMTTSVLGGIYKSNKRMNDILEMGTRVAEFKNAKMGYHGTLDRLQKSGTKATLANATRSSDYAAFQAKQITLNFSQHGVLGKELNKYIPFFNASMQGIYKTCNTLDLLINGKTISNQEDSVLRQELMFKIALVTAMAIGTAAAGAGDEDYDEAPDYLKENFWVFPDGIRIPKDQVIGTLIGSPIEKIYGRVLRGDFGNEGYVKEMLNMAKDIASCFSPDKIMPEAVNLAIGHVGGYDTFRGQAIVPEYMADKIGHLQKDIGTSHFSDDLTTTLYNFTKNNPYLPTVNLSAKKVDWALRAYLTNVAKYTTSLYDLGLKGFSAERYNEKMSRGYDKNDATGQFVETLSKVPVLSTFTTSKNTYKTISDYNEKYKEYKQISSDEKNMTVSEKRKWKRYQDAEKRMKSLRKQLKSIRENNSLSGDEKRQRADKIFKQQIKIAEWAEK